MSKGFGQSILRAAMRLGSRLSGAFGPARRATFADHLRDALDTPYTTLSARALEHYLADAGEAAGPRCVDSRVDIHPNPQHANRPAASAAGLQ